MEAVLFDLDGVLVSTDEMHYLAWRRLADELGIAGFTKEDNIRQRGVSRMESLEVVLEKADRVYTDEEKLELATRKNMYYVEMLGSLSAADLLPGAIKTLTLLRARGVKIALGSASKNAPLILERVGISSYFDAIADGRDTTRSKPDPQVFLVAAQKLGVSPARCLVVEDADAGIAAGNAGGMATLGVGPAAANPAATFHACNLDDPSIDWDNILAQ